MCNPMSLHTDPSEHPGTPEYDELREERQRIRTLMLDLMEEQRQADMLQYPYRISH